MLTTGSHVQFIDKHTRGVLRSPIIRAIKAYRSSTRHLRVLPDFIIIGARKCGTTSLYEYLARHPSVLPALSKELFFFDYHYEKRTDWYRRHFPTQLEMWARRQVLRQPVITGEATPSYFYQPVVARRIKALLPNVKLILLLREPVAAAYSAYQFGLKMGTYTEQEVVFEQTIQNELDYVRKGGELFCRTNKTLSINPRCAYLGRHAYIDLLQPWLDVFERSQIKILLSEELFSNPAKIYKEVQDFLHLPEYDLPAYKPFNQNEYHKLEAGMVHQLEEFFAPFNERLSRFLGKETGWQRKKATAWGYTNR